MEIGACEFCVVADGLEAKMAVLRELGYDFIEPAWRPGDPAFLDAELSLKLARLVERTGCAIRSAIVGSFSDLGKRLQSSGPGSDLEAISWACDQLGDLGGDVLLLPNWAGQSEPDYDDLYVDFLRKAAEAARFGKVRLGVEHIPGSKYRNTAAQVAELVARVGSPDVGVYYDIANNLYIDDDPVAAARAAAPCVVQYHVKGYPRGGKALGDMPLDEVKAIMEAAGFRGRICVETDIPENAAEPNRHLAESLETLRAHGI